MATRVVLPPVGFRNEREFVGYIEKLLRKAGHKTRREVSARSGHRIDLLAVKRGIRKAIEVKFSPKGLLDDISKGTALLQLPEVDEVYACAPAVFFDEDSRVYARNLGTGLLAVDGRRLIWLLPSRRLEAPRLVLGGGYGGAVHAGDAFVFQGSLRNDGVGKTAFGVRAFFVTGGPFVLHPKKPPTALPPAEARLDALASGKGWDFRIGCVVKRNARPGRHSLLASCTASNAERADQLLSIEIVVAPDASSERSTRA